MSCSRPLPAHQATVHPSEFILRPGDTRQLTAVVPPMAHAQDVGAVLVLSGDETLRQELRRRPPGAAPSHHAPANLRHINFQRWFVEPGKYIGKADCHIGPHMDLGRNLPRENALRGGESGRAGWLGAGRRARQGGAALLRQHEADQAPTQVHARAAAARPSAVGARGLLEPEPGQTPLELTTKQPPTPATDTGWWPRPPGLQQVISDHGQAKLRISTNHLMFPRTPLGVPRSLTVQLTNLSGELFKWNIFGYSMPYLITGVNRMVKCGYDVFKMRPKDDIIKPGQTLNLQVTFSPPYPGQLTQLFQLLCKPAKETPGMPMVVYTLPVQVSGRGSILDEGEDESDLLTAPLHVSEDYLFFGHLSVCHKLEITNKMPDELPVEYRVTGPFKVVAGPGESSLTDLTEGHMMAPSQRYVQMYVYFCPEQAGAFSGQLKLWLKSSGWRHLVRLEGTCQAPDAKMQAHAQLDG